MNDSRTLLDFPEVIINRKVDKNEKMECLLVVLSLSFEGGGVGEEWRKQVKAVISWEWRRRKDSRVTWNVSMKVELEKLVS